MESIQRGNLKPSKGKAFWEDHINQWQQSELSKAAYCRTHGLATSTLDSWRRKLRRPDGDKKQSGNFLSLQVQQASAGERGLRRLSAVTMEIQFPQGIAVKVNSPIDHEALFQVLQLVRQLP